MQGVFFGIQRDLVEGGDIQYLADQGLQAQGLALHDIDQGLEVLGIGNDLILLHGLVGHDDRRQRGMEFMSDAVDEVGFHLGELFLPHPVAECDKEKKDHGQNREQRQQKGRHHEPQNSGASVPDIDKEAKADAIGIGQGAKDRDPNDLVSWKRFLQGTPDTDAVLCLDTLFDQRVAMALVIQADYLPVSKDYGYVVDEQHIFQVVLQMVLLYDTGENAVGVIGFSQGGEDAVADGLLYAVKSAAIMQIEVFETAGVRNKKAIDDMLSARHHLVIADRSGIFGAENIPFFQVEMVILQLIGIVQ